MTTSSMRRLFALLLPLVPTHASTILFNSTEPWPFCPGSLATTPGGSIVYATCQWGGVMGLKSTDGARLWNTTHGAMIEEATDTFALVIGDHGSVRVLDPDSGRSLWGDDVVNALGNYWIDPLLSDDKAVLYIGRSYNNNSMYALRMSDGSPIWNLHVSGGDVRPVHVSGDRVYATVLNGQGLWAVDATDGSVQWKYKYDGQQGNGLLSVAFAGQTVYVSDGQNLKALSATGGESLRTLYSGDNKGQSSISLLGLTPDKTRAIIATDSPTTTIHAIDLATGAKQTLDVAVDGRVVPLFTKDGSTAIFKAAAGVVAVRIDGGSAAWTAPADDAYKLLGFSADGTRFYYANKSSSIVALDALTGRQLAIFPAGELSLLDATLSPDASAAYVMQGTDTVYIVGVSLTTGDAPAPSKVRNLRGA